MLEIREKSKILPNIKIHKNNLQPLHLSAFENNPTFCMMNFVREGTVVAKIRSIVIIENEKIACHCERKEAISISNKYGKSCKVYNGKTKHYAGDISLSV